MILYLANAGLFEPSWSPTRMTEVMNTGAGVPTLVLRTFRVVAQDPRSASYELAWRTEWLFLSLVCLSFSEINLENMFVFHPFRQTHGIVGQAAAGSCAWCLRHSGNGRSITRGRATFSPKRRSGIKPLGCVHAHALLPLPAITLSFWCPPPLLWPPLPTVTSLQP